MQLLDSAGGGALRHVLSSVEVVSGRGQHEEGLLHVSAQQGLQREPAGAEPQPQTQSPGVDPLLSQCRTLTSASLLLLFVNLMLRFPSSLLLSCINPSSRCLWFPSSQDISEMERELEILLGELHIKMKGTRKLSYFRTLKSSFSNQREHDLSLM